MKNLYCCLRPCGLIRSGCSTDDHGCNGQNEHIVKTTTVFRSSAKQQNNLDVFKMNSVDKCLCARVQESNHLLFQQTIGGKKKDNFNTVFIYKSDPWQSETLYKEGYIVGSMTHP